MYKRIMVPVDLAHVDRLEKALATAADLARHYAIPVCYAGVAASTPGALGHNPGEYAARLAAFAGEQGARYGHAVSDHPCTSHDPAVDLGPTLMRAIHDTGADLVVMASHVPGLPDHFFTSNAGWLASHADISVLVVR